MEFPSEDSDCDEVLEEAQGLDTGAAAAPQFTLAAGGDWKEDVDGGWRGLGL
jgi:hypothetical protein